MATVAQLAKAALQRILVQASEARLEPDEYQDFIFALNNYMLALDAQGISLGFTEVSDLGDEVTVPVGALRGIIANMAIEVAPDYNGQISQGLQIAAMQGMDAMRRLGQYIAQTRYPCTLPVGSGNEGEHVGVSGIHFYPCDEAEILAETTGAIGLEINTNAVAEGGTPATDAEFLGADDKQYTVPEGFLDSNDVFYDVG